jgi:tetratricopeptide (TPR) repeat protein
VDVSKLLEKAREAAERRNYEYAIELYLQACKLDMDNATARRELRAVENRWAKEKGSTFWSKGKTQILALNVQGLFLAKKYDAAIEKAEETLKSDPGNISVLMILGRAALASGYRQSAIATFEDIRNMNAGGNSKQLIATLRELARAYEADGRINEAQDTWAQVNKLEPGDREASVKIRDLSASTMTKKIETAATAGGRGASARNTQTEEQKKQAARLSREAGDIKTDADLKAAIDDTLNDIQKRSDDPRLYAKLGDLHKQGGNYAEAKKNYEIARQKDPNNPTYLFKSHDLEIWKMLGALKALQQKANAGDAAAREQFIKDKLALLDYRLTSFLEREKQYSTDSRIRFELGCIYHDLANQKGDKNLYDEAIKRFQATFQDPKYRLDSGLKMGLGFAAKGQFDLALKRFDESLKGLELKNDHWKNLKYAKADTLQKSKHLNDSKKVFLEIYEIDVSFKDVGKRVDQLTHLGAGDPSNDPGVTS